MRDKFITVIICTHNRSDFLKLALSSLVKQSWGKRNFTVCVVDNNSTDNTKEVVSSFEASLDIKYIFEKTQGLSHARNRGVIESGAKYLVFLDDDAKASVNWLEKAALIAQEKKPDIFGGPIYPFYESKKPRWFLDQYETLSYGRNKKELNGSQNLFGSNIFIKKNLFDIIGKFNTELGMRGQEINLGEEIDFQNRARLKGVKIWYNPELIIHHLVAREKLSVYYILRRSFAFGKTSRVVHRSLDIGLSRDIYYLIREIVKFLFFLGLIIFRDRKKYPYWQNYFLKYSIPISQRAGRIKSYFN